jgi:TM2 domain-containing membrane protein YozV
MVATVDAKAFCARCGERSDQCACERSNDVLAELREQARRAAKAVEAPPGRRSPTAAALLSLVLPGLGQLYNGDVLKAVVFFLGWILVVPWALAVMDAYYSARVSNLEDRLRSLGV